MKKISCLLLAVSCFLTTAALALAVGSASLSFSPANGSYQVGQTFKVVIYVNPVGEMIDMVRAKVSFPAQLLEIQGFSFYPSFNFPAGGNSYDNTAGTLSYGAGIAGGTDQTGPFGTITFKVKAVGEAPLVLGSDSLMLAGGEDKFNGQKTTATFTLSAAASSEPTPSPALQESPKEETPEKSSPKKTSSPEKVSKETPKEEVVALGEEIEEKKESGITSGEIIWLVALVVLAIAGGFIHKFKNKKQQI